MIPLLLMLADAPAMTPIDAERAFAADAQTMGQWKAFAKWSADNAVMFVPQPTNAHAWLKDRKEPAKAIDWWPTASWISCDGTLAVNTGGWQLPDGKVGYFSTVWQRQPDGGWKWIVDGGDDLATSRPRPAEPKLVRAACRKVPGQFDTPVGTSARLGLGRSKDLSIQWMWEVSPQGDRVFIAQVWNGKEFDDMIKDKIPAAK